MDYNIKLSNGQVLKGIIISPGENARAVLVLVHGLGEHIQRYNHWADLFRREGIAFTGVDLPGHGRSEGRRGHIRSYNHLREMVNIMLNSCRKTFPSIPIYLYGHSLGGGIVLDYVLRENPSVRGVIVTSPWLRLSFEPPRIKVLIASALESLLPGLVQPSGLNVSHISHDLEVVEKYKNDPLIHDKISLSLLKGAMSAGGYALGNASALRLRTLIIHGSDDMITSPEASRLFCEMTEKAEYKEWPGGYHELHNEPFRDEVFRYIIEWINRLPV